MSDIENVNQQPNITVENQVEVAPVTTVGTWLTTFLVLCIPIVGFIMTIVWMVSAKDKSRANYFKAMLIMYVIILSIFAVLSCAMGGAMMSV